MPKNQPRIYNVLVLCTGNSARSIMTESAFNDPRIGGGKFRAYSAGSQPTGRVNPGAARLIARHNMPASDMRSKSWNEFAADDAPMMDFIITVCGNAANETCPIWPGQPTTAHWGVEDPADAQGSEAEIDAAFEQAFEPLKRRVKALAALPLETMSSTAMHEHARKIGTL